jgi:phosphatidylserine decarboxylase
MTGSTPSTRVIDQLKSQAQADSDFKNLLTASLQSANSKAKTKLAPDLYNALTWPVDFPSYLTYLAWFAEWSPHQSSAAAWKTPNVDPADESSREVYDHLCHFYWLIDQRVGPNDDSIVQNVPWFSEWLISYADAWGSYLNTTDSFSDEILETFIADSPRFQVQDSMIDGRPNAPSGWLTFNQFFARELNPGLRPIDNPMANTTVTSPADCTFKATYPIAADSTIPRITVKQTHPVANVEDLLERSEYKSAFAGGTFVHYFLGPYSYHRFHTPVAGMVRECYPVQGLAYLAVNINQGQFDAPDSAEDAYEFTQARGVITIDTAGSPYGDIGVVAVVPVGMCQVSSVNMTATPGRPTLKGDEFGYFLFGGSDIIVLFQAGVDPELVTSGGYLHYGNTIATCVTRNR